LIYLLVFSLIFFPHPLLSGHLLATCVVAYCRSCCFPTLYQREPRRENTQIFIPRGKAAILVKTFFQVLKAIKNAPRTWEFATWDNSNPFNIKKLNLNNYFLYGEASFSGLAQLQVLNCNRNGLTKLDVTKCTQLRVLKCNDNNK